MTITESYNKNLEELNNLKEAIRTEYLKAHMLKNGNFSDMEFISGLKMDLLETIYPKVKSEVILPKIRKILPY